jgi:tRNA-Thr(GGU) m(6)t(6)A37 methyltransferase TsaA
MSTNPSSADQTAQNRHSLRQIATIHSDFPTKFGIPKQSGLVDALEAVIVFEPEFRNPDALRGIEDFSHLWLIWQFSAALRENWSPMVRPPRLGGNQKMGVFATRSPFRPNPIGLSVVRLLGVEQTTQGAVLHVAGADLMDQTPIYDIKPYLPYVDCVPQATGGFTDTTQVVLLQVDFPEPLLQKLPPQKRAAAIEILKQDPRPHYQKDPNRMYGFPFSGFEIKFQVQDQLLRVCSVEPIAASGLRPR